MHAPTRAAGHTRTKSVGRATPRPPAPRRPIPRTATIPPATSSTPHARRGRLGVAGAGEREVPAGVDERRGERQRERAATHTTTATPPRRGSPAPVTSPVRGSRRIACTPPKNTLRERKRTISRPGAP